MDAPPRRTPMTNEQRFKQCLEWILDNIHKPFVDTSIIEHHIIHTLHVGNTIDTPIEKSDNR